MGRNVLIRLFTAEQGPGIRDAIRKMADWRLSELDAEWGTVEPAEGAGVTSEYFKARRLCDASTELTDATWDPVRRVDAFDTQDVAVRMDPTGDRTTEWKRPLIEWADRIYAKGRRGSDLVAMQAAIDALPLQDLPGYLAKQVPELFRASPEGSFWLVETDTVLTRRLAILRILLNQELIPDVFPERPEAGPLPGLEMLQEHSLTGATFGSLIDAMLLALPPATLGFTFERMPHSFVFLSGKAGALFEDHPPTLASIYAPRLQSGFGFHWRETDVWDEVTPAVGETLLQWWVTRLNVVYSHAADPTRYADGLGRFQPTRQAAWLLTFERMLADLLVIRSNLQGSALALHQAAFDLLDKAEVLLGYGSGRTGKGFQRLLQRGEMLTRLNAKWDSQLPLQLRSRFKRYTEHLYDRLYEEIRENAYEHRLTPSGVRVWSDPRGKLVPRQMDDYVPKLVRSIRNSAHGLVEQLESPEKRAERNLIATHTGKLPAVFPDLAALLGFALVADAEALCSGTWLTP